MARPASTDEGTTAAAPQSRAGRPRKEALAPRRRHLLDTARRLFIAHGLGVPIAQVASSAGVALRTIYQQYGGKDGLLGAVIEDEARRHHAQLAQLELEDKSLHEQLRRLALHVAARVSQPDLMRLCDLVRACGDAGLVAAMDRAGPGMVRQALARALGREVPGHEQPGEALCDHFMACMAGPRFSARAASGDPELRARRGLALFLGALPPPG